MKIKFPIPYSNTTVHPEMTIRIDSLGKKSVYRSPLDINLPKLNVTFTHLEYSTLIEERVDFILVNRGTRVVKIPIEPWMLESAVLTRTKDGTMVVVIPYSKKSGMVSRRKSEETS